MLLVARMVTLHRTPPGIYRAGVCVYIYNNDSQ